MVDVARRLVTLQVVPLDERLNALLDVIGLCVEPELDLQANEEGKAGGGIRLCCARG